VGGGGGAGGVIKPFAVVVSRGGQVGERLVLN